MSSINAHSRRGRPARLSAYAEIRRQILDLTLKPNSRLDEVSLADSLGASRTPVREALHQLAGEELVKILPRGGYQVVDMDIKTFRDVIDMQMLITRAATHMLVTIGTDEDFDKLAAATARVEEAIQANDPSAIAQHNAELHALEAKLCNNPFFTQFAETIYTHTQRFAYLSFGADDGLQVDIKDHFHKVDDQHQKYLDALRQRDLETALQIAEDHVKLFRDRILHSISMIYTESVDVSLSKEDSANS